MLSLPVPPNSILHQRVGQGHKLGTPVSTRVCLEASGDSPTGCRILVTLTIEKGHRNARRWPSRKDQPSGATTTWQGPRDNVVSSFGTRVP